MAFAAQALDLPMRMNEDGFADQPLRVGARWLTRLSEPALYRVSVRNLAALTRMRLTTILCQLADTFAGFLPTVDYSSADPRSVCARPRLVLDQSESQVVCCLP
jgi:hypothetical protein